MLSSRKNIKSALLKIIRLIPQKPLEDFIFKLVEWRVEVLPASEALRFLFNLENRIYPLQGRKSIEYNGGIHSKHRHIRYHDFFIKRIKPKEAVLDIGCGIGALTFDVAEKTGAFVTGIDIDVKHIEQAKKDHAHPNVNYITGDALKDLPKGTFDVVILSNVLEHMQNRPIFLNRIKQSVGAKRFLIRVPLFERDWRVPLKRELGIEFRLDNTHETEYTLESFTQEISEAGLKIIDKEIRWGEIWGEIVSDA